MEQLSRIKARRTNLEDLLGLFRALRGMAASHMQEAQKALSGIHQYIATIERAIGEGATLLPAGHPPGEPTVDDSSNWLVALCPEHGFTAGLSDRILGQALEVLSPHQRLGIVGRRGAMVLEERAHEADWVLPMSTHVGGVVGLSRQVIEQLSGVGRAEVIYPLRQPGGNIAIKRQPVLPLAPELLASVDEAPPLHYMPPVDLLAELAEEYLFAEISRAIMETVASENAARLQVMMGADFNTKAKLSKLKRLERSLRQEAITAELLELATGVDAARQIK